MNRGLAFLAFINQVQILRSLEELNLQKFDPNGTLQVTTAQKLSTKFNPGDIVFDTNKNTLEFFNGEDFEVLSAQPAGSFDATASLGQVSVSEEGSISINVSI